MIEEIVRDYLSDNGINAFMEENGNMPEEYVLVEKAGSSITDHISKATIIIQSYAKSLLKAARLNEKVKPIMLGITSLNSVSRCELNSDYNYTSTSTKKYRYQAVYEIVHY